MSSEQDREIRSKEILQRLASEFGHEVPKYWERELWITWFELEWER